MRKEIPAGVLEMLAVPGLRPDKVLKLHKELGIISLAELEQAAREDRLQGREGPGRRAADEDSAEPRHAGAAAKAAATCTAPRSLLENARSAACASAHPELKRITPAGDFRRGCELVGDISPGGRSAGAV